MAQGFFHEENYVQCGNYIYSNLGNWFYKYGGIGVIFNDVHLFDGTLTHQENGSEVNYPNLDYGPNELMDYFNQLYCDRYLAVPFKNVRLTSQADQDVFLSDCVEKLRAIINHYTNTNSDKFLGLLETMFFDYSPIENYNMTESGTDVRHPELTTITSGDSNSSTNGTTTTTTTADSTNKPTTKNYTTTYDDSTEGRLQSYSTTEGQSTTTVTGGPVTDVTNNQTVTENGTEQTIHNLTRSGNIGVTTTQQMIEQERNILRFNIIKEYFDGLVPLITLAI